MLDKEFEKALRKIPAQLDAINKSWKELSETKKFSNKLNQLNGLIVSYMYTGMDVEFYDEYPLINMSILFNAIQNSTSLEEVYQYCCNVERLYKKVPAIKRTQIVKYAGYEFKVERIALEPGFETEINNMMKTQIWEKFSKDNVMQYVPYVSLDYQGVLDLL